MDPTSSCRFKYRLLFDVDNLRDKPRLCVVNVDAQVGCLTALCDPFNNMISTIKYQYPAFLL